MLHTMHGLNARLRAASQGNRPCKAPSTINVARTVVPAALRQHPVQQQQPVPSRSRQPLWCRSALIPDAIPADVKLEVDADSAAKQITYDEATKTVRIPLAAVADGQRRSKMVMFTCNRCGGRSARLVNPVAWEKGAVFAQCQHCDVWHTLAAAPHIIEEVRYNDPPQQAQPAAAAAAGASEGSQQSTSTAVPSSNQPGEEEVTSAAAAPQQLPGPQ